MRKFRILALFVVVATGITFNLTALPQSGVYREFYSDGTFSTLVGWRSVECTGGRSSWGVTSAYSWAESWACNGEWVTCEKCADGVCWFDACPG
ncbi:MAG TPA: DUF6289 family protein [Thermoanaerobaculia bacterium]